MWSIQFDKKAFKEYSKLNKSIQVRIMQELEQVIIKFPRDSGKPLKGKFTGLWRYRISDYRVVCEIMDTVLVVMVVRIAHRKEVYK